jgi:hypothetical protein
MEELGKLKTINDLIWNRTRELLIVPWHLNNYATPAIMYNIRNTACCIRQQYVISLAFIRGKVKNIDKV